jgi:cytochrome c biogenesis protein CcdA
MLAAALFVLGFSTVFVALGASASPLLTISKPIPAKRCFGK